MKTNVLNRFLAFFCLLAVATSLFAADVEKTTFTYSKNPDLKLDKYEVATSDATPRPVIIFAFGGGFTGGERDAQSYVPYFNFMARNGYVVCSIDYRTSLAGYKPNPALPADQAMQAFGAAIVGAITDATTDYLTATAYILSKAEEWNIDPGKIVATGSSAGAITALQAEYVLANVRNGKSPFDPRIATAIKAAFPETFNYAALVSFAGAILSMGEPENLDHFCPTMMFHGDADNRVPYNSLVLGPIGLYGSHYLAEKIKAAGGSGAFWTQLGAGHSMADVPMIQNLYDIAGFLFHFLRTQRIDSDTPQPEFIWTTVTIPGLPPYNTDFTIADFIKSNMP